MLSQNVQALVAAGVEKKKNRTEPVMTRGAVINKIYLWTSGRVPYIIDSEFGEHEEYITTWIKACLARALPECVGGRGGGVLRYMGYIGIQGPKGYFFLAVLVINWVSILAILV